VGRDVNQKNSEMGGPRWGGRRKGEVFMVGRSGARTITRAENAEIIVPFELAGTSAHCCPAT
jgi:hypothetical protein